MNNFLSKGSRVAWCVFVFFALLLFSKILLFHWNVYHSFLISSIWSDPISFWSFWLPKIGMPLFVASFVFFSKRNWWTIIVALIIDTWMMANMFYLRSNGILFDGFTFTMAGNMDGFWSSVLALYTWADFVPYGLTILYIIVLLLLQRIKIERYWKIGCAVLLCTILLNQYSYSLTKYYSYLVVEDEVGKKHSSISYMHEGPLSYEYRRRVERLTKDYAFYHFSVIHGLLFVGLDTMHNINEMNKPYDISNKEELAKRLQMGDNKDLKYDNLLVIIIVESLESWAVNATVMPYLQHFMDTHPVLHAKYLKSQIVGGSSADGQMIINTGLLPIQQGAACFRYPWITYPSFVNRTDSSVTILTHGTTVWNQEAMSKAYGYDLTLAGPLEDSILVQRVIAYAQRDYKTIQAITMASHVPFHYADRSKLNLPKDMPNMMANYIKCLNWTDEGLGYMFDRIDTIPELANATIVITGDHTVFWQEKRNEFETYCKRAHEAYDVQKGYVPLIIYSPEKIKQNVVVEDINYQMDLYPTVMCLQGVEDYYWKGFGVNLLDSVARYNRRYSEEEAYFISDELIRANWFETYNK